VNVGVGANAVFNAFGFELGLKFENVGIGFHEGREF
jgi:hypothetical protein